MQTSFQFGGAFVLAVTTAVMNANIGSDGSAQATLDGFQAAVVVSVIAATLGVLVMAVGGRRQHKAEATTEPLLEPETEAEA